LNLLSSKKLFVELLRSFINKGWVQAVDEENDSSIAQATGFSIQTIEDWRKQAF